MSSKKFLYLLLLIVIFAFCQLYVNGKEQEQSENSKEKTKVNSDFIKADRFLVDDFMVDGQRHIMFATKEQLSHLKIARRWFIDGTFKVVRRPFYQLMSIHTFVKSGDNAKQIPLLFVLMSKRRKTDYTESIHGHKLEESSDDGSYFSYVKYKVSHSEFLHGFIASLSMIVVSELGDKTFFIAAIMAMRHSRAIVLAGALGALVAMTILSALLGYATTIIPRQVTYYASSILFLVFGVKMLKDGWYMSPDEAQEEYEEAQAEIKKKEDELFSSTQDIETGVIRGPKRNIFTMLFSAVFIEAFVLTFLAEWGDRSQIATIILAAREDVIGVIIGGCLGHALCTGLAVLGGRIVAQKISARTVTLVGGIVFILFAVTAFLMGPD